VPDFKIDLDLTGLPAINVQPTFVANTGVAPTLDMGSPPSVSWKRYPFTNSWDDPGELQYSGGTLPSFVPNTGSPPQIALPSLQDIATAIATAVSNLPDTWNFEIKIQ